MTVNDLISDITSLRGQQYGTDMIMGWINEIEGQVIEEVINRAEGYNLEFIPMEYEKDQDKKLSIPDRFKDVYVNYMLSKIDYHNEETERYNNDVVLSAHLSKYKKLGRLQYLIPLSYILLYIMYHQLCDKRHLYH